MAKSFHCHDCHKVALAVADDIEKCPACGSANGEQISADRVKEGLDSGALYNIDPKTGGRAKKRRR